jgi:hypothetical protein
VTVLLIRPRLRHARRRGLFQLLARVTRRKVIMSGLLGNGANGSRIEVSALLDSPLAQRIGTVVDLGCLVSVGTTRDRGALSITITYEGEWDREYFRSVDDAIAWLESAHAILSARGLGGSSQPPTTTQKPRRGSRTPL